MNNQKQQTLDKASYPIIIIGMHRSGTTMIASMLRELGLFIGDDLEDNSEPMFFINHNDWLFHQCGGKWDNPSSIKWLYENPEILRLTDEYIRERIDGLLVSTYLGWQRFLLGARPLNGMGQEAWGWKDPRTTYTLPFWLRLFPNARVIHIYRNGVPVAASLRAREMKLLQAAKDNHIHRKALGVYNLVPKKSGFVWSTRCLSLEGGFSLWEEYVEMAIQMMESVAPYALSLKYEDFLANPTSKLLDLSEFCGLSVTEKRLNEIAAHVKPEHANAHESDEELAKFSDEVRFRPLMMRLGYA